MTDPTLEAQVESTPTQSIHKGGGSNAFDARTADPYLLCWNLLEVFKAEVPRSTLTPAAKRVVAQARKWIRCAAPSSELRVSAGFALAELRMAIPQDEKTQGLLNTVQLGLTWLPDAHD